MVTRIVKMTFRKGEEENFIKVFDQFKEKIRASEGCERLELFRDTHSRSVFFTHSLWKDEKYLHNYRDGKVFNELWPQARVLFAKPAEAWTIDSLYQS